MAVHDPLLAKKLIRRYEQARDDRFAAWDGNWRDVADYVAPSRSVDLQVIPGTNYRRTRAIVYDSTAIRASGSYSAAFHGLLVNPALRWYGVALADFDRNVDHDALTWLYDTTSRMLAYSATSMSGWPVASDEFARDNVSFGTAVMLVREKRAALQVQARRLADMFLQQNDDGDVVETYRYVEMPAWEVAEKFADSNIHPEIIDAAKGEDEGKARKKVRIIHAVGLRRQEDIEAGSRRFRDRPWHSVYIDLDRKSIISEDAFRESPYIIGRHRKSSEDVYGDSPALEQMANIKTINVIRYDILMASDLANRPPLQAPAGGIDGTLSMLPGAFNWYRRGVRDRIEPINTGVRPDIGRAEWEQTRDEIEKAHFLDALDLPKLNRMTTVEVVTRRQQGLLKASPVISRAIAEWVEPYVHRLYRWMRKTRRLMPPPPSLVGRPLKIRFLAPMALSQRSSEALDFIQAMTAAKLLVDIDPRVVHNIDADIGLRQLFEMHNVDPRFLKSMAAVKRLRAELAKLDEVQQQIATAGEAASAARDAGAAFKDVVGQVGVAA